MHDKLRKFKKADTTDAFSVVILVFKEAVTLFSDTLSVFICDDTLVFNCVCRYVILVFKDAVTLLIIVLMLETPEFTSDDNASICVCGSLVIPARYAICVWSQPCIKHALIVWKSHVVYDNDVPYKVSITPCVYDDDVPYKVSITPCVYDNDLPYTLSSNEETDVI